MFAPIHMKSWPKVKLGQVQVGSNIAQNLAHRKSFLVIIFPNSHEKLTKSEIKSIYYLLPKYNFCPYLALLTYMADFLNIW